MSIKVSGAASVPAQLSRAFTDKSQSNSDFTAQMAKLPSLSTDPAASLGGAVSMKEAYAFANEFAAPFASMSNADLSKEVLTNMGILPTADTSVAALEKELTAYFAAFGLQTKDSTGKVTADTRGTIVLQLANLLSTLEDATGNLAVYKLAALAWNDEIAGSYAYSKTVTNTVASAKGSIANQPATFALTVDNDTKVGTAGDDIFDAKTVTNSFNGTDSLDGSDGKDTLNVATTATSIASGVTIKSVESVNIVASGAGFSVDTTKTNLSGITNLNVQDTAAGALDITTAATTTITATTAGATSVAPTPGSATATATAAAAAAAAAVTAGTAATGAGPNGTGADQAALTAAADALKAAATALIAGATTAAATTAASVATAAASNAINAAAAAGTSGSTSDQGALNAARDALFAVRDTLVAMSNGVAASGAPSSVSIHGGGGVLTIAAGTNDTVMVGGESAAIANAFTAATVNGGSTVSIKDQSGASGTTGSSLTAVSLNGNTGAATLTGNGLATLNLTKTTGAVTVNNTTAGYTLTLNTNGSQSDITDSTALTAKIGAVNIANTVADSQFTLTANSATTVNVSGEKAVVLKPGSALAKNAVITSTNTGGVTVSLTDAAQSFKGSALGNDTVTITAVPTGILDGGVGGTDTLVLNSAAAFAASTWWNTFKTVSATAATTAGSTATAAALTGATAATTAAATDAVAAAAAKVTTVVATVKAAAATAAAVTTAIPSDVATAVSTAIATEITAVTTASTNADTTSTNADTAYTTALNALNVADVPGATPAAVATAKAAEVTAKAAKEAALAAKVVAAAVKAAVTTATGDITTAMNAAGTGATPTSTAAVAAAAAKASAVGAKAAEITAVQAAVTFVDVAAKAAAAIAGATPATVLAAAQTAEAAAITQAASSPGATQQEALVAATAATAATAAAAAVGSTPATVLAASEAAVVAIGNTNTYKTTNFEILGVGSLASGSYDATGFTGVTEGPIAAAVTFTGVANNGTFTITASPGFATTVTMANATGAADALTINLGSTTTTSTAAIVGGNVTVAGVENITVNTIGSAANSISLTDPALKNLTLKGNAPFSSTLVGVTDLRLVDGSTATGALTLNLTGVVVASTGVTIKGGAAADTITLPVTTGTPTNCPIVTLGGGADTLVVGAAKVVAAGGANNSLTLATQFTTVTDFSAGDTISFATGGGSVANASGKLGPAQVSAVDDYNAFLALATSKAQTASVGQVSWFQTGGNTFVVQDNTAATNGVAVGDIIVKLVGLVDLSNATVATGNNGTITMV